MAADLASLSHKQLLIHVYWQRTEIEDLRAGIFGPTHAASPRNNFPALNKSNLLELSRKLQAVIEDLSQRYNTHSSRAMRAGDSLIKQLPSTYWSEGVNVTLDKHFSDLFCKCFELYMNTRPLVVTHTCRAASSFKWIVAIQSTSAAARVAPAHLVSLHKTAGPRGSTHTMEILW